MKIFQCSHCFHPVYFENALCERCEHALGFDLAKATMITLVDKGDHLEDIQNSSVHYHYCENNALKVCNWLIPAGSEKPLCQACDLNRTIPNIDEGQNLEQWRELENAKHRLVYALGRCGLPIESKEDAPETGLWFDFLSEPENATKKERVLTGHANGLITINLVEADSVLRERARTQMGENYRTLIGHFRHEVGHYYWDRLIASDESVLADFRELFGDERADYGEALKKHYADGPPADWRETFISAYAASHPWEDWAEIWAHYFHCMGTLEMANSLGLSMSPQLAHPEILTVSVGFDPYVESDFEKITAAYVPVTLAINSMNRSMGQPDLYPFVLSESSIEKLHFIHKLIQNFPLKGQCSVAAD
ncbi:MAG: zinc-binding metallopeptidase family protein [Opitutaceae bacterium]